MLHSVLCNRVLLQILRQRTGSLTVRVPVASPDRDRGPNSNPMFTSFMENEEMDTNITIVCPSDDDHVASSSSRSTRRVSQTLSL